MKQLIWAILGILGISIIAIIVAKSPQWSQECQRPIQIVELLPTQEIQQIVDLRTGITVETVTPIIIGLSPNGAYQYIAPDLPTIFNNIDLLNIETGESQPIYSTTNELTITWAADSQSLYLMEVEQVNRSRVPVRFVRIEAATGDITHEYPLPSNIFTMTSADQRFLYFSQLDDDAETNEWRAINTITSEMTDFRLTAPANFSWSPDGEWVIVGDIGELYVVNAETSESHPHITVINGHTPYWTNDSIWYQRWNNDYQTVTLWRASLSDGSVTLEYDNAVMLEISDDDRWRYIGVLENGETRFFLHDILTDERHENLSLFLPQFSADSHCLLDLIPTDTMNDNNRLQIYDLETMQAIFNQPKDNIQIFMFFDFGWYEDD